jgi:hypothetical protein
MTDLLDAFDEGGTLEDENPTVSYYQNKKSKSDYVARIVEYGFGKHENKGDKKFGQPFFGMKLEIVDGLAPLSKKVGDGAYDNVAGRPGDEVSLYFNMSQHGKTPAAARFILKDISQLCACLTGNRSEDYSKDGAIGPQGIRTVLGGEEHVGRMIRFVGETANSGGYYNLSLELIPEDEVPAKETKAPKKAAKAS